MRKLALVLLAACSGSDHHQQVAIIDSAIDSTPDAPPVAPTQVTVAVFGTTPALVAYRDGGSAWQTPTGDGSGNYTLTVTNDYQMVVACHDSANASSQLLEATAADGRQLVFCSVPGSGTPTTVAMTGHMVQAGDVWFGDTASSTTAPWDFTLNTTPGMHDVIAMSTAHGMVIRRNQNVTTGGAIPSIDVANEGTAMTSIQLTINGVGSDTLDTELDLFTQNEFATWLGSTPTIYAPPASLLTASDFQFLFVQAHNATSARFADTQFTGSETTFDLPPALTGIAFGAGKASWGSLPAYDQATFDMQQSGTLAISQSVVATKGWIEATHATSLGFDAMPPGFDASWSVDASTSYLSTFQVTHTQGSVTTGAVVFSGMAVQRGAKRPWFSTVDRLRESMRSQHTMPRR